MVLLLHEDLANLFRHRVFSKLFTLPDPITVIANRFVFILEIVAEHGFGIFRCAYGLGSDHGHFAEIVNLPREDQRMIELLLGVDLELGSDIHVLSPAEHLGINDVGDDGLIFARKVFVQQLGQASAGNLGFVCGGLGLRHWIPPLKVKARLYVRPSAGRAFTPVSSLYDTHRTSPETGQCPALTNSTAWTNVFWTARRRGCESCAASTASSPGRCD